MPSKASTSGESACTLRGQTLTSSEVNVLFGALNNLLAPLEINMEGAAASAGLKLNSYKKMYRQLRRKYELGNHDAAAAAVASAATGTSTTPKRPLGGTKRTAAEADPNADVLMEESPAKKKATPRKPRMTAKQKKAEAAAADAAATEGGIDFGEI
ncbi:hypothetical protein N0V85_003689 [Neurospora sp. IMI 360204]|nr:hypothetical protein N0V85_003689 [Neurospora sp. IMI 360204]